jgi:hypothetical protein
MSRAQQASESPGSSEATAVAGILVTCRLSRATSIPASTTSPAPSRVPHTSARRLVNPPTIRVPARRGKSAVMPGSTTPDSAMALASRTSYVGDGVQTAVTSTDRSGSVRRTVWVKAVSCVLSTRPSITRS